MKSKKKSVRRVVYIVGILFVIAAIFGLLVYLRATRRYDGGDVTVYIPRGADRVQVTDSLTMALGEDFTSAVNDMLDKLPGDDIVMSGAYNIGNGDRAIDVARMLRNGRQTPVRVTFNNVRSIDDLASRLDPQLDISASEFVAAVDSVLSAKGIRPAEYMAHFLPDTYEMYWDKSAADIVERLDNQYGKFWTAERQSKAARLGLTPLQVSTLASIVEEETAKIDERPKVARLYLNRLDRGMKLQADPTVKFAVGDFSLKRILSKHLVTPSPYNTYINTGLPPGPIRIVEGRTIDAVLDAPVHPYIYMCAKEDFSGYHNFATDYNTHFANARRYQQALNSLGIK